MEALASDPCSIAILQKCINDGHETWMRIENELKALAANHRKAPEAR